MAILNLVFLVLWAYLKLIFFGFSIPAIKISIYFLETKFELFFAFSKDCINKINLFCSTFQSKNRDKLSWIFFCVSGAGWNSLNGWYQLIFITLYWDGYLKNKKAQNSLCSSLISM